MKRTTLGILAVLCALLAFSCKKSENNNNVTDTGATSTSVSATDTSGTTSTNDTSGTSTSGTTSTTSTGSTGGTVASLSDDDKKFVMNTAMSGIAEVAAGQMAASKGTSPDVKNFGNRMVNDHGKSNDELKSLATNKGLSLPSDTDAEHKAAAQKLSSASGAAFDKEYMAQMVKDHEKAVADFTKESQNAKDPDLKQWTTNTLPVLQDHLKMAKDIHSKMK